MKRTTHHFFLLFMAAAFFFTSCKKEEVKEDLATIKKNFLTGTWKQKDLALGYPIKFAGQKLPVGFSLYNITSYLPVSGPLIDCTKTNTYTFDAGGGYTITGCTDLILPHAGNSGKWNMQAYGSALHLVAGENDTPLWIESIDANNLKIGSLSYTINIYEADPPDGADIPVFLLLEKQ
ncbi:MAG: hypothetical protein IT249_05510 [Chitinophagaceae bacterium]|nr:hypothetical protein [Chitinophagaceae bacterium]